MDHSAYKAAFEKGMADRGDNHTIEYNSGEDKAVTPGVPDRQRFAENDGDDKDLTLAFKSKSAEDSARMPSISDAYNMGNRIRRS